MSDALPPSDPRKVRPDDTVLKALFKDGDVSRKSSTPGLTAAAIILSKQNTQLVANQAALQAQNRILGDRVQRLEGLILGTLDEPGMARSTMNLIDRQETVEKMLTANLGEGAVAMQYFLDYLPTFWGQHARLPNHEEAKEAARAIEKVIREAGEKMALEHERLEELSKRSIRCAFCVHWQEASRIVSTEAQSAKCAQPLIQVACQSCGKPHMLPVDPMNVTGNCDGCKAPLTRERGEEPEVRTNCMLFHSDRMKWRDFLRQNDVPQGVIDTFYPPPLVIPDGVGTPGDPGIAVAP